MRNWRPAGGESEAAPRPASADHQEDLSPHYPRLTPQCFPVPATRPEVAFFPLGRRPWAGPVHFPGCRFIWPQSRRHAASEPVDERCPTRRRESGGGQIVGTLQRVGFWPMWGRSSATGATRARPQSTRPGPGLVISAAVIEELLFANPDDDVCR
jgi:hypothetical protein